MHRYNALFVVVLLLFPIAAGAQTLTRCAGGAKGASDEEQAAEALSPMDHRPCDTRLFDAREYMEKRLDNTNTAMETGNQRQRQDSLWNGAAIGAALGTIAGIASSYAITDCMECAGFNVPLTFGVLGGGVGAALGAGIDALHDIRLNQAEKAGRVAMSPLLTKARRGIVGVVRF
jgi:hypothetical protein